MYGYVELRRIGATPMINLASSCEEEEVHGIERVRGCGRQEAPDVFTKRTVSLAGGYGRPGGETLS